ncbi:hypothetical protein ACFO5R_07555 [Halosolutus amylolyticus]|uniref:Uncharacterized protein n=1 Tax=Halosolutus amylolyticus TaxID=2932267 RepID=A0ABD5PMT6_9EURY|nr:hypothetical protein [Halosolutus amylolyticus]
MNSTSTVVTATLTVRVPLRASGDLADGARRIVERTDAVDRLERATVRGVSPGLNDTTVDLHARVALDGTDRGADEAVLRRDLERGAGVVSVDAVESADAETQPIEAEVG